MTRSQTDSISALDDAKTGTEADAHDRSHRTTHVAAVAQHEDRAGAGEQRGSGAGTEARQLFAAPDQRRGDVAAELQSHVAAVRDRDEHRPHAALPMDAKAAQSEAAHDAPRHAHPDADPKAQLHIDATTAQRACPQ